MFGKAKNIADSYDLDALLAAASLKLKRSGFSDSAKVVKFLMADPQNNGKKVFFTFTIEVQRIDITSRQENAEDLQWTVQRKYSEFYTLESKLTEFHGTFEDLHLPAKASLFTGKGLDVMHANRLPFQDYLTGLLKKPFLRESDILFTFLTSPEEFTLASSTFGVGRIINKVNPMKLTIAKERGQNLQPFIDSFVASTLSPAPKPR